MKKLILFCLNFENQLECRMLQQISKIILLTTIIGGICYFNKDNIESLFKKKTVL